MRKEKLHYKAGGLDMEGWLCMDETQEGRRPAVLVFPEAPGLGDHAKWRAEQLAAKGYVALACDLHGGGTLLTDYDNMMATVGKLLEDRPALVARATGALEALVKLTEVDPQRVAAIGYCMGGTIALELARSGAELRGVVTFHGGLSTTTQSGTSIRAKVLVCTGADDPAVPVEQRNAFEEEMRLGGVDWRMHVYGGVVHSFTNKEADTMGQPQFLRYDAGADARSWQEMSDFFAEIFQASPRTAAA